MSTHKIIVRINGRELDGVTAARVTRHAGPGAEHMPFEVDITTDAADELTDAQIDRIVDRVIERMDRDMAAAFRSLREAP